LAYFPSLKVKKDTEPARLGVGPYKKLLLLKFDNRTWFDFAVWVRIAAVD
jgi:hypothetical protein